MDRSGRAGAETYRCTLTPAAKTAADASAQIRRWQWERNSGTGALASAVWAGFCCDRHAI